MSLISTPQLPSRLDAVSSLCAFAHLSAATRTAISEVASLRPYRKDAFVFIEGDDSEFFCFVVSGVVRTYKTSLLGTEQTLEIVRHGELFSVTGFVTGGAYGVTAAALEPSLIGFVKNDALRELTKTHADLAWVLLQKFGERLIECEQHVASLTGRDTATKLARALLQLGENGAAAKAGEVALDVRLTHRELAQLVGCSRETVTRTLRDFREDGSVDLDPAGHLVLHLRQLERHAKESA